MKRFFISTPLITLFLLLGNSAIASIDVFEFSSEDNRLAYASLTTELRCPKCQNQDIKDSNSPIASDMRREVYRLIEEGKSNDQIINFMKDRFGEFVTYKPKVSSETYLLWYGPWVFIVIGLLIISFAVRNKMRGKNGALAMDKSNGNSDCKNESSNSAQKQQVDALLKQYDSDKMNGEK